MSLLGYCLIGLTALVGILVCMGVVVYTIARLQQTLANVFVEPILERASLAWDSQDYNKTIQECERAARRFFWIQMRVSQAICYRKMSLAYSNLGAFEEAVCYSQKSMDILKQWLKVFSWDSEMKLLLLELMETRAIALTYLGDSEQAIDDIKRALGYADKIGETDWLVFGYTRFGTLLGYLPGKQDLALTYLQRAMSLANEKDARFQISVLYQLAEFHRNIQRNYQQAYLYAEKILHLTTDKELQTGVHLLIAQLYAESGVLEKAELHYRQVLEISLLSAQEALWIYLSLAGLYAAEKSTFAQALKYKKMAMDLVYFIRPVEQPKAWLELSTIADALGNEQLATQYLENAFQSADAKNFLGEHYFGAMVELGHLYKKKGAYARALQIFQQIVENQLQEQRSAYFMLHENINDISLPGAVTYVRDRDSPDNLFGSTPLAKKVLESSTREALLNSSLIKITGEPERRDYKQGALKLKNTYATRERAANVLFNDLLELLLPESQEPQQFKSAAYALKLVDEWRATALAFLANLSAYALASPRTAAGYKLWEIQKQIKEQIIELNIELQQPISPPATLSLLEKRIQVKQRKHHLQEQLDKLYREIKRIEPDYLSAPPWHDSDSQEILTSLKTLANNTAPICILSYWATLNRLYIFALRSDMTDIIYQTVKVDLETLDMLIHDLPTAPLQSHDEWHDGWEEEVLMLSAYLLPSKIKTVIQGCEKVIIVPHDNLRRVPFAILSVDQNTLMLQRHALIYLFRASFATQLLKNKPRRARNALILITSKDADDEARPFLYKQAPIIKHYLNSEMYTEEKATCALFRKNASNFDLIHIAAHGQAGIFEKPEKIDGSFWPGILLRNEILSIPDLVTTNLSQAVLVNLGGCSTNLGMPGSDDDWLTAGTACLVGGAKAVLASIKEVEAEPTAVLMNSFYEAYLGENLDKAAALQKAMLTVRESHPHPRDWACFILMGDWR